LPRARCRHCDAARRARSDVRNRRSSHRVRRTGWRQQRRRSSAKGESAEREQGA